MKQRSRGVAIPIHQHLEKVIDEQLASKNLTRRELAKRLHWPESKISKLCSGAQAATISDLTYLSAGLGVPFLALLPEELLRFGGTDEP